jgi:hypothetical protein
MGTVAPDPKKCGAKLRNGTYCAKWPMQHCNRCERHGAKAPQVQAKAMERRMEAAASAWLAGQGVEPLGDVAGTLEELMAREVARFRFYEEQERRLAASDDLTVVTASQGEQLRALALGRERAAQAAQKAMETWMRLGMDERRLQHDEARVRLGLEAISRQVHGFLDNAELGLSPAQKDVALRLLSEGL